MPPWCGFMCRRNRACVARSEAIRYSADIALRLSMGMFPGPATETPPEDQH